MGGNKDDENVIIPDEGAAKYWYVDPRASTPTPSSQMPALSMQSYEEPTPIPEPENDLVARTPIGEQDRADEYDQMRSRGIQEMPNALKEDPNTGRFPLTNRSGSSYPSEDVAPDNFGATGTFEIDGLTYILPTEINGQKLSQEEAIQRYQETGQHLGVFLNDRDAQFFETNYLQPTKFQF